MRLPKVGPTSVVVAALALAIGYADLWRGGSTTAALLLTVGYVVLVPVAIMVGGRRVMSRNSL